MKLTTKENPKFISYEPIQLWDSSVLSLIRSIWACFGEISGLVSKETDSDVYFTSQSNIKLVPIHQELEKFQEKIKKLIKHISEYDGSDHSGNPKTEGNLEWNDLNQFEGGNRVLYEVAEDFERVVRRSSQNQRAKNHSRKYLDFYSRWSSPWVALQKGK